MSFLLCPLLFLLLFKTTKRFFPWNNNNQFPHIKGEIKFNLEVFRATPSADDVTQALLLWMTNTNRCIKSSCLLLLCQSYNGCRRPSKTNPIIRQRKAADPELKERMQTFIIVIHNFYNLTFAAYTSNCKMP